MRESIIKEKLLEELQSRGHRLMLPHCAVIAFTAFLFKDYHEGRPFSYLPYVIILGSLLGRYFIMRFFFGLYKNRNIAVVSLFLLLIMGTALGWGMLFLQTEAFYGLFSVKAIYLAGVIMTLMSGSMTVFASDVRLSVIFILSVLLLPAIRVFQLDSSFHLLGYLFIGNGLYQIQHSLMTNRYLVSHLKDELSALEQRNILQEYIDALPGIVGLVDKEETYVMVNNYLDGTVKDKIIGTKVGATLKNNPVSELILNFMKSADTHWVREVHAHDLTGENWYMVNLKKISTPQEGVIVAILPINDLVKAKSDLKIQEARTQYAAKLASLGEFSAGIAHEVSNPLTIIEGASNQLKEVLKEGRPDTVTLNRIAYKISDTTQRIGKIVKSLRILANDAEEEPFKNLSFLSIIEPAKEITKAKLDEFGIELRIFNSEDDVALFGSEIQLSQVILNLISNSIDAVKDLPERWIEIHYRPNYEWSDILVVDSGSGISDEILERIMEPFFTTKDSLHGTGLGLSISKNIIERHFGTLLVEQIEKNTTFKIRLPRMNMWQPKRMGRV